MRESQRKYLRVKQLLDRGAAVLVLALCLPLMTAIAIVIRLVDGGPVLFRQSRVGLGGAAFTVFKFRTMNVVSAKRAHVDRVTRTGHILRRFGLDELPQLINIARGEMSFVGPRPTLPEQVARYGARERGRLGVRPGLTGWAQIQGRNAIDWHQRIALDLWYVDHISWSVDLRILARTLPTLMRKDQVYGPEGVNDEFVNEVQPRALAA